MLGGLVVYGAMRNTQCTTFLRFKFIAYLLKGFTETSALVCLRSAEYIAYIAVPQAIVL